MKANSSSTGQKFSCRIINPNMHHHIHKITLADHIQNLLNQIRTLTPDSYRINFNTVLTPTCSSSESHGLHFKNSD
jgi:hypothetical protein